MGFTGFLLGRKSSAKQITTKGPLVFWIKGPQACESMYWRKKETVWTRETESVSESSNSNAQSSNDPSLFLCLTLLFILAQRSCLLVPLVGPTFLNGHLFSLPCPPLFHVHHSISTHDISSYIQGVPSWTITTCLNQYPFTVNLPGTVV